MKKVTIEQILFYRPCSGYDTREKIIAKTGDVWPLTPLDIAQLYIPIDDRIWALLQPEILPEKQLHLLACDFAERTIYVFEYACLDDNRPRRAIEVKRLWVNGKATDEELQAAWDAAWDAARDAARAEARAAARAAAWAAASAAASAAAWATAWDAARATARVTAWDAEKEWQLGRIVEMLKEEK